MPSIEISPITADVCPQVQPSCPRVALLTPYTGGNLGDAAIQDAVIANLRRRMPGTEFLGITLSDDNFLKQHGAGAFPLLAAPVWPPFRRNQEPNTAERCANLSDHPARKNQAGAIRRVLRRVLVWLPFLKRARAGMAVVVGEILHSWEGYRVIRRQDLLIVSGGGQLDERWGGPWRLPFAVCKWALLARAARVPCVLVSVGACQVTSWTARRFFSSALRMCCYRSYRDAKTRAITASFWPCATQDSVVADLAFSLSDSELPSPVRDIRTMARGRPVIAVSPIAYGKPGNWPTPDPALHNRYVRQMAQVMGCLARRGYFVVLVCSSLGDDEGVIPNLMGLLDEETRRSLDGQIHFPKIQTWSDLVAVLSDVDYLIASRLHGAILGFLSGVPAVAISFHPKVDWLMDELHLTDYLLQIADFTAEEVLHALDQIHVHRDAVLERIRSYRQSIIPASSQQYDYLAALALAHLQLRN